jgi:hypothetical protein
MFELRFHRELYDGAAVDVAVRTYERYARIERTEEPTHWVLRIRARTPERERAVALELGNYALGTTIRQRGPAEEAER